MHWIYHPQHDAKIVGEQEYFKLLEEGWYDSPAKFPTVNTQQGLGTAEVATAPLAEDVKQEETDVAIPEKKRGRPKKDA
jgi:hypothetical protein